MPMLSLDFMRLEQAPYDAPALGRQVLSPYFFSLGSTHSLETVLKAPHHLFLEISRHTALNISLTHLLADSPDFALCLSTVSTYRNNVAHCIAKSLGQRFGLPEGVLLDMQTCLQEALLNAIVHGNLALDSCFSSVDELGHHYFLIEQRLKREPYRFRRVTVTAWNGDQCVKLGVTDQGAGFSMPETDSNNALPHGRGMMLIRAMAQRVWIGDDTRTLYMEFKH